MGSTQVKLLDAAVRDARSALTDLVLLMVEYGLEFPTLSHLREWPESATAAYMVWALRMENVARIISLADGIEPGTAFSIEDRERLTGRAFESVMLSLRS